MGMHLGNIFDDQPSVAGLILRTRLTDFNFDFASTVARNVPFMGATVTNEIGATVDAAAHTVTGVEGRFNLLATVSWGESVAGNTQRNVHRLWVEINGVQFGPNFDNNYTRDIGADGSRAGQTLAIDGIDLVPTDVVRIRIDQLSGAGGVQAADAGIDHELVLTQTRGISATVPNNTLSALANMLLGTIFYDTDNTPAPGKLFAGQTYNWADNPNLQAKFNALGHDFIVDNGATFTVVAHTDFIRAGVNGIGTHVDDTTAVNGLAGTVETSGTTGTNTRVGGSSIRIRNTQTRAVTLTGDIETAPDHRNAFFGIYGDI